ncbi:Usher multi-domain protein [Pyrenophora tritici-repentis]|uniref:Uncharacterized protein n=1 Tax=Pyrenophora tritici-repentis TaxID=45151 RepID=A0A5M9L470_9PLEO|nr:Usher multi-domain protein [Pyrenophora tritici-repentis]KAF7446381.1 Usher multi-domain protein [Pyrenophora tritici-repentis]KAF7567492.1 hypothetical protein PtrM4_140830 [Pyrenophora tritici-repentis]
MMITLTALATSLPVAWAHLATLMVPETHGTTIHPPMENLADLTRTVMVLMTARVQVMEARTRETMTTKM